MQHAKLILGVFLIAVGAGLVLGFLPGETPYPQEEHQAAPREARAEYVEKRNYTYLLSQSFLLRNPSNNTVADLVYMFLPVNASNQFVRLLETSLEPLYWKNSGDGGVILVYNVSLPSRETTWLNATLQVTVEKYRLLAENLPWLNYSQVEKNTGGKRYWAVENQTYVSIAQDIGLDARDPLEACRNIGKWILARLDYQPTWRRGAEHALVTRGGRLIVYGDCEEVADVFVTLARILGIRSRVAHGLYLLEDKDVVTMWIRRTETGYETSDNWGGHAWPQIYVSKAGWVDVELLEGGTVKIGDFSQYHVKYGFEEKSFLGSTMLYCQAMYLETDFFHFTFRRVEG
ncbi:MAG: transglutaminase-like domain-containing protein [Thermoproteota archaeon]